MFSHPQEAGPSEAVRALVETGALRLERIVSHGHVTPPGTWSDQSRPEWVVLLSGAARLRFEGEPAGHELEPGDWCLIPAHCRHRVEWTAPDAPTVWLALHFDEAAPAQSPAPNR